MSNTIAPESHIGAVHLTVADLDRALPFYTDTLGFSAARDEDGTAALRANGRELVRLVEVPGAQHHRHTSGLYHYAILVPSRVELARSLARLARARWPMQGFSDHLVSEAIYLPDPDGNGIEIYRDRPRDEWRHTPDGQVEMATIPLDVEDVLRELPEGDEGEGVLDPETTIGHVHLHVAEIDAAERFYGEVLGLDLMARYGDQASFMSAGGYHHHLGMNTWAGVGVPPAPPNSVGLRHFEVVVPDDAEIGRVADRAREAGVAVEERDEGALLRDPSANALLVRTPAT